MLTPPTFYGNAVTVNIPFTEELRLDMKRKLLGTSILALTAFALFAVLTPVALAADCTLESAKGTWAYSFSGSVFNAQANAFVPVASVGRITFDGNGNVSGRETQASPSGSQEVTFSGTYTENHDCTGTVSLRTSANRTESVNFVVADDDNEAYLIITSPGSVMTGTTKREKYHGI